MSFTLAVVVVIVLFHISKDNPKKQSHFICTFNFGSIMVKYFYGADSGLKFITKRTKGTAKLNLHYFFLLSNFLTSRTGKFIFDELFDSCDFVFNAILQWTRLTTLESNSWS